MDENCTISTAVRMALARNGRSAASLAREWEVSKAAITNKFYRDSWSGYDLVKLAGILGCGLYLEFPDGQRINLHTCGPEK